MIYYVTIRVDGRYVAKVEADSVKDAINLAEDEFMTANLNEMEYVESETVMVEDEKGDYVYEK